MKKLYYLIMMALWVIGVFGGIGYLTYYNEYPIAIAIAATGFMAWPTVREYFTNLVLK